MVECCRACDIIVSFIINIIITILTIIIIIVVVININMSHINNKLILINMNRYSMFLTYFT